ncbi:ABC transporter substrate-binding protein [Paracoccus pantotrophus]|uniref:ABC transporter substrate-binding protein n=1 Tax=Paracoccus pantotrophus TaxID=82367 RepID=UPI000F4238A4|nr:ABC transporter substrate-binding protein [Paracoccus pantotrophus]RNI15431.1 ABC transporter substrate-binding protein [Paracoccus pantotrophus]
MSRPTTGKMQGKLLTAIAAMATMTALGLMGNTATGMFDASAALAQDADTLRIGMRRGLLTFDPHNNGAYGTPLMNVFDTLVRRTDDGEFVPHLAKSFEQKDDYTWEFVLHQGIKFHDGSELTARDVKFTLDRVVGDTRLIESPRFSTIKEVKILDPYTVQIITNVPDPVMLNRLIRMGGSIMPEKYFNEVGVDNFTKRPVGSGPYKVAQYNVDQQIILEKFKDYFKGDVSDWDKAVLTILPEASTRVNELITGGMDLVDEVPPSEWARVNGNGNTAIVPGDSTQVIILMVNSNEQFPTSDVRVRQAIDYAIDDKLIVDKFFQGMGTPTRTHITPGIVGFNEEYYDTYLYDLEKAKELLAEAGYDAGNPLSLTLQVPKGRYLLDSELGQLIGAMLQMAGIQVNFEFLENSKYVEVRNNNNNKELMLAGYGNSMFDPFLPLNALNSKTYFERLGYRNERVDQLLDQAEATIDQKARAQMYREAQAILAEELPFIYIYAEQYFTGINTNRIEFAPPSSKDVLIEDMTKAE